MKIAIVETAAFGGLLHYATQLADGLAARGHEVDLIVPKDNELSTHRGSARMRDVLEAPSNPGDMPTSNPFKRFKKRAGVAIRLTRSWWRVVREARTGGYDAVIVNCDIELSVPALGALVLVSGRRGPRMVEIVHNAEFVDRSGRAEGPLASAPILRRVLGLVHSRYDLALVHGQRSEDTFVKTWPHRRVAQIPHGDERIFAEDPPPLPDEQRILFFGDWNRIKGIPLLMKGFDELVERLPSARLTLAGMPYADQVDVEAIRRWASGHGDAVELDERYIPIEEVRDLFGRAQVVVTPYEIGYQSGVVHLAMTMARPVVATNVGDLGSVVIDEETGLVVPPGDAGALAHALERVLTDRALAERLGAAGRAQMASGSSWESVTEKVEQALEELLAVDDDTRGAARVLTTIAYPHRSEWNDVVDVIDSEAKSFVSVVRRFLDVAGDYDLIVLDGASHRDQALGLILSLLRRRRPILYAESTWGLSGSWVDRAMSRLVAKVIDSDETFYCVLSRYECESMPRIWGFSADRVFFTPFYATLPDEEMAEPRFGGEGVFAGGDSLRDYSQLLEVASTLSDPVTIATGVVSRAKAEEVPSNVEVGRIPHDEFVRRLQEASVVVVPFERGIERSAGQQTYLNAMALGKIVVVTDGPGVDDYIRNGQTGLVVDPDTPGALGAAIRWALEPGHESEQRAMRERARAAVLEGFTADHYVQRLLEVIRQILAERDGDGVGNRPSGNVG